MRAMLKEGELQKLRMRAKYNDNDNRWILPPFFIKEKQINLPKIKNAQALVHSELEKREMVFEESERRPIESQESRTAAQVQREQAMRAS